MNAVRVRNLNCGYGRKQVLRDVSFHVGKAEFFCIIGANGSGKTTLFKTINRELNPDSGQIELFEKPVAEYSQRQFSRLVAMVTQDTPGNIPYSVRDIVMMGRYPHMGFLGFENRKDRDVVRSAMSFTDIEHIAGSRLNQISGGERQRVFIARAICQEPDIIFLDEPTASLDLAHQVSVMDLMEKLKNEQGITVVMISHDINLAAMYSDRLLLLKNGKVIKTGSAEEVITFESLESAYGCTVVVKKNPLGEFPQVSLVPHRYLDESLSTPK